MKRRLRIASEGKRHVLSNSGGRIELWSAREISNEPKHSWMKKALKNLQNELGNLDAGNNQIIEAKYISTNRKADVENILFYNVRAGNFKKSSRNGLRFRYLAKEPPQPPEPSEYFPHYQSYELVKKTTPFLNQNKSVASYEFDLPPSHKPEPNDVWWGSVNAEWNLNAERKLKLNRGEALEGFALCVNARCPQLTGEYAVRRVKEVFDGIASAMHFWGNPNEELVLSKVAGPLDIPLESVLGKMRSNDNALLGERELLIKRNGINWDPADDRLVAGELLLSPNQKDDWSFRVEILFVE